MKTAILLLAAIIGMAHAVEYCQDDDGCKYLGAEITCRYSMCDWGMCGCERGKTMMFAGSEAQMVCAPIKKIGESCDHSTGAGYCGAENSECIDGICQCLSPTGSERESRWGGENCLLRSQQFEAGEPCWTDSQCEGALVCLNKVPINANWPTKYLATGNDEDKHLVPLPNSPNDGNIRQCGCPLGTKLKVPNYYSTAPFMGRQKPVCVPKVIGDSCQINAECGNIEAMIVDPTLGPNGGPLNLGFFSVDIDGNSAAVCTNNECACRDTSLAVDITGLFCAPALSAGATCAWRGSTLIAATGDNIPGICDGANGYMCGDPCDLSPGFTNDRNYTCKCAPGWEGRGTTGTCTKVTATSTCKGDMQCKSMDAENPICSELGLCTDGATSVAVSLVAMILPLVAVLVNRY